MREKIDFERIVWNISQVVIVLDRDLNIVWANKKAADVAGTDPVGHKCHRLYMDNDSPCEGCHTLETFETGRSIPNTSTVAYGDGSERYFDGFTTVVCQDAQGNTALVGEIAGEVPTL
ncbi:PAS domain-containing protein [Desulfoplanes sp.]